MKRLLAFTAAMLLPALGWAQANSYTAYAVGAAPSFEGMWWNPSESGWGVSVSHQADILFAVWYTYDRDGKPMWLVMPDARLEMVSDNDMMGMTEMSMMGMDAGPPTYSGALYRTTGPAFSAATFDPNAVGVSPVGTGMFVFNGDNSGVFAYTVGDVFGTKQISRMAFGATMPRCSIGGTPKVGGTTNYQDLWWRPSESGWGVNLAHQGDTMFATWYSYDANGKGLWFSMSNTTKTGEGKYAGKVYTTTGPSFDSASWNAANVHATEVGDATFNFNDASNGTFTYTIGGATQSKAIQRMVYSVPASVCN